MPERSLTSSAHRPGARRGAADQIAFTLIDRLGLAMFYEVAVVVLAPLIIAVAHRARMPFMKLAIPAGGPRDGPAALAVRRPTRGLRAQHAVPGPLCQAWVTSSSSTDSSMSGSFFTHTQPTPRRCLPSFSSSSSERGKPWMP